MTRYFVHPIQRACVKLWCHGDDWFSAEFRQDVLREGYVECGWLRYQYYKWWKAR